MKKKEFLLNEVWLLTVSGAFQRSNAYKTKVSTHLKNEFRKKLHELLVEISKEYENGVSESKHMDNIERVHSFEHESLSNNQLNFGISQKLLNLYLKYLWCLGYIETPPHFPLDRIIQQKLYVKNMESWTKMNDKLPYLNVMKIAKEQAEKRNISLAELELELFNRR